MLEFITLFSLGATALYLLGIALAHVGEKRSKTTLKWHCLRCKQDVDHFNFRCGCTTSPSPWVAVKK